MGKCKKRTLAKTPNSTDIFMTRESAVNKVFSLFQSNLQNNRENYKKAQDVISLFGLSAEELSERGLKYEELRALGSVLS